MWSDFHALPTNNKAEFGFLVMFFSFSLALPPILPFAAKKKALYSHGFVVWIFFVHCICNFSSDTSLVFRPTQIHQIDATFLSLRKRTSVERKAFIVNSFPYWLFHCCLFLLSSRYQIIGGFVLVFCSDCFFDFIFFLSGIGNLQEKVSLDVLNQKAIQRKFCRIVYIQVRVHEQIAL